MATMARGRLRPNLPQRLTPGCTLTGWDMPLAPTAMVITVWVTLPTLATEAAEMATEPWCPAPVNSVEVSALVLMK